MAKFGVGYSDVEKAANTLIERGETVSISNILKILGTGSRTTINNYLKQWREEQPEMRTGLPEKLAEQVKILFERMREQANEFADKEIASAQEELICVQTRLKEAELKNNQLLKELNAVSSQMSDLKNNDQLYQTQVQELTLANSKLSVQVEELKGRVLDKQQHIEGLERQLTNVQDNLEHYRESVLQQKAEEKAAHEKEVTQLNQELLYTRQQQAKEVTINRELTVKMNDVLSTERELNAQIDKMKAEVTQQRLELNNKEKLIAASEDRLERLTKEYNVTIAELNSKNESIQQLKIEQGGLIEKVKLSEEYRKSAEDKLNRIQHDKLFLFQENIELKSNIKRLEDLSRQMT